jgi:hypothetical protein
MRFPSLASKLTFIEPSEAMLHILRFIVQALENYRCVR